jgi:2-dehydro-3-deoxygluconokinase
MGGLIYGLITWPKDDQKALDFAVAASCLKHTILWRLQFSICRRST